MQLKALAAMVRELPPAAQAEVVDFVEFLVAKRRRKSGAKLRHDWAGALGEYAGQYSALELQEKSLEWRED